MKRYLRVYAALVWAGVILALTTAPLAPSITESVAIYDKLVHAFLFGALAFLLSWAGRGLASEFKVIALSGFASLIYSASIEYLQSFLPARHADPADFFAGAVGIVLASALTYYVWPKKKT